MGGIEPRVLAMYGTTSQHTDTELPTNTPTMTATTNNETMESVVCLSDKLPFVGQVPLHRFHSPEVSLAQAVATLVVVFVACNLARDVYWRYGKRYPPIASWLWVPVLGHLPAFLVAPKWFVRNAYKQSGQKPFVLDVMSFRFVVCGRGETDTVYRATEDVLEPEAAVMKLTNFDLTLGPDLFRPVHPSGSVANAVCVRKHFTPNMNNHVRPMAEECLRVAHEWYERNPVIADLEAFVLDVVAAATSRALLGQRLSSNPVLAKEMKTFSAKVNEVMKLSAVVPRSKLSGPVARVTQAKGVIAGLLLTEIRARRKRMEKEAAVLLEAEQKDAIAEPNQPTQAQHRAAEETTKEPKNFLDYMLRQTELDGTPLTDERVCSCMFAMIFAAYDTTTHATTHLLYDLAGRKEVLSEVLSEQKAAQNQCRDDIKASGASSSPEDDPLGFLSTEALKNMRVLESALRESQRLSASVFGPLRMAVKEGTTLRDGRTVFPKGSIVTLSPWLLHHDPSFYPNPDEFRLERFQEAKGFPSMKKFLNFGGGKHHCPGRFFATLEIKCIVSALLSQYEVSSPRPAPYTYDNGTIIKRKPVPIRLKRRTPETKR